MPNNSIYQKELQKIIESQEFASSTVYGKYLSYLVEASIQNKNLKETTIAIEFFDKSADFNPAEDTIVRSHTYKLRKKLERYYFTEGKEDKYRIKIPKGHYQVSLVEAGDLVSQSKSFFKRISKKYSLFIILILILINIFFWRNNFLLQGKLENYQILDNNNFIWTEYLNSKLPILIVIGDHFIFNAYIEKYDRNVAIRDLTINSLQEMEALKSEYSDFSIEPEPEPYFPYHSIWGLPSILSIFYSNNQYPILRRSSSINPQMLDEYNIVFVGSIKTLYSLRHTIESSNFKFQIAPHTILYTAPDSGKVQQFSTKSHSTGPNEDLVLALKLPGPKSNSIIIIASYHSLGAPEIANYFTDKETQVEIENIFKEKLGKTPKYFEMLFKVIGIDKTAYSKEILVLNEIN